MFEKLWNWLESCSQVAASPDLKRLENAFTELPETDQIEVSRDFVAAISALHGPSLWAVGSLLFGQPLGDDSFKDFRRWVVLGGRNLTDIALSNPDRLSEILDVQAQNDQIFVEAIERLEDPASRVAAPRATHSIRPYVEHWTTPNVDEIKGLVPLTFKALGGGYSATTTQVEHADHLSVDGLGDLKVGDRVLHRGQFGVGIIRAVRVAETGVVDIEFASGVRTMRLSASFFEKTKD